MSYLTYYNLKREPFGNAPDKRFFFRTKQHDDALLRLQHVCYNQRGFAVCTGPIGHGKTTLARRLYDLLPPEKFHKALLVVIHSDVTPDWLLLKFSKLLGVKNPRTNKLELLGQIYTQLRKLEAQGKRVVMIIDEAQMLKSRVLMEEFRGLLNIELKGRKLINFVFFGLENIEDNLKLDQPLRQRVALRVLLQPYTAEETKRYIQHRMEVAGGSISVFPNDVIDLIQRYAQGTPRVTNTICDNLLLEGFFAKKAQVDTDMVREIARNFDLSLEEPVFEADPENQVAVMDASSEIEKAKLKQKESFKKEKEVLDRTFKELHDDHVVELLSQVLDK